MTLRMPLLALKPFFAMLIFFGLVFSVSVDAAVCGPEIGELTSVEAASSETGQDLPDSPNEQHGICAHGHCHHGVQFAGNADIGAGERSSGAQHFFEPVGLTAVQQAILTPPPRI